jgi:hypothetical protein
VKHRVVVSFIPKLSDTLIQIASTSSVFIKKIKSGSPLKTNTGSCLTTADWLQPKQMIRAYISPRVLTVLHFLIKKLIAKVVVSIQNVLKGFEKI